MEGVNISFCLRLRFICPLIPALYHYFSIRRVLEDQHNLQSEGGRDLSQLIMGGRGGGSSMSQESS